MIWHCGVRRSVVLSSLVRCGVILACLGVVRSGFVKLGTLLQGVSWLGLVRSSPVRYRGAWHGLIDVLRGLVSSDTVLSCPVRLCTVRSCGARLFEVWRGILERGPVLLGQVRFASAVFGNVRRFMVRSSAVAWGTVERGFAWLGNAFRGIALNGEALYRVVKFCPVKHCYVSYAKALSWFGEVLFCGVGIGGVLYGKAKRAGALSRSGMAKYRTVLSGFVRLRAAEQGLVRRYLVRIGCPLQCVAGSGFPLLGTVLLGKVLRCPAWFCSVKFTEAW